MFVNLWSLTVYYPFILSEMTEFWSSGREDKIVDKIVYDTTVQRTLFMLNKVNN